MAVKSLTVTEDAYKALKNMKHGNESFSEVILRIAKDKTKLLDTYFGILRKNEYEAKEWKETIKKRRKEMDNDFIERQKKFAKIRGETHGNT